MPIESPTYINQLNSLWPLGSDDRATVDNHLRLIKAAVLATFPAITGAVSASHTELNLNVGNTETIGAKLVQFSLSISAINTSISALTTQANSISNTVSVLNARIVSMSADVVKFSLSISALNATVAALGGVTLDAISNTISVMAVNIAAISNTVSVMNARLVSISALNTGYTANLLAISNTVSVMAARIATLSISVSVVQAAVTNFPATERTWSAQQIAKSGSLTDSVSIAWDCDADGQIVAVTLAGNRTMEAPTNISPNAAYVLVVRQDATGSRSLAWASAYYFPGGADPILTAAANSVDIFTFIGGSSVMYCVGTARGLA